MCSQWLVLGLESCNGYSHILNIFGFFVNFKKILLSLLSFEWSQMNSTIRNLDQLDHLLSVVPRRITNVLRRNLHFLLARLDYTNVEYTQCALNTECSLIDVKQRDFISQCVDILLQDCFIATRCHHRNTCLPQSVTLTSVSLFHHLFVVKDAMWLCIAWSATVRGETQL